MVQNKNGGSSRPSGSLGCSFSQIADDLKPMVAPAFPQLPGNGKTIKGEEGWSPTDGAGSEEELAEDPPLVGEKPAEVARQANQLTQRPGACHRRVGEGRAQAQTVAAPASGRPAASPHSCPCPSPSWPPRLTVPGRAHELVQQGPHLRLGGHGGRWVQQERP